MNSRMAAHHSPRNKRDCAAEGVCAKEIKPELNTLDEADFVRDVENSASHHLSQSEMDDDNPCSQQSSPKWPLRRQQVDYFRVASDLKEITDCDGDLRGVLHPSTDSAQCKTEQLWHFLC
jgi:hypothetical protein